MTRKKNKTPRNPVTGADASLRQRAEERLRTRDKRLLQARTPAADDRLFHEPRVHQIELEMQNEELRWAQEALEISHARYFELYDLAPVGYITLGETGLIQESNIAAATLLNAPRTHLVRQPLSDFILPEDQDVFYHCHRQLWSTGAPQTCELRLQREDSMPRWIHLENRLAPVGGHELPRWRIILSDITERKQDEQQLQSSLVEKTLLVKEIHHRVRNNLQVISSLLSLQASQVQSPDTQEILQDMQRRIRSMSLLHESLYQRETRGRVNGADYLGNLCHYLSHSFSRSAGRVQLIHQLTSVELTADKAIICGLIVNELVSNAFKHAFPGERIGHIRVVLAIAGDDRRVLAVSDDGVGISPDLDWQHSSSLGLQLVPGLVRQLGGKLEMKDNNPGTLFCLTFLDASVLFLKASGPEAPGIEPGAEAPGIEPGPEAPDVQEPADEPSEGTVEYAHDGLDLPAGSLGTRRIH